MLEIVCFSVHMFLLQSNIANAGDMLEHQPCANEERHMSAAEVSEQEANGVATEHLPPDQTGLNGCNGSGHAAVSPQENGLERHEPEVARTQAAQDRSEEMQSDKLVSGSESGLKISPADAQTAPCSSPALEEAEARLEAGLEKQNGSNGVDAAEKPGKGKGGSKQGSIESNKELKGREEEKGKDKGERSKSRGAKDSRKDSKGDRSRSKASKDKDKEKDKKRSRRSTRSRSRSRRRRGSKHRSPGKLSPPRKRRAHGSRSSSRSSSPSPRPRFSRGISPGAMPPRSRYTAGGMHRSPPFNRGAAPPAGPWGYGGGGPPYEPHGYGPPRGGYSPPRRWPGPGRSPPPYGYERPYGYGGPPPGGSRSPPPGQIYGRNPTTGSPLYGPPPPHQGGPWERALPLEPRPSAQGKVWGARSGWDSVALDAPARDVPLVRPACQLLLLCCNNYHCTYVSQFCGFHCFVACTALVPQS